MMPYIRLYTSLIADLDFLSLDNDARCMWYEILLFATERGGMTPSLRAMAKVWGKTIPEVEASLYPLVRRGWLVLHGECIEVVNWSDRQAVPKNEANARRQADYRKRLREAVERPEQEALHNVTQTLRVTNVTVTVGGEGKGTEGKGELTPNGVSPIPAGIVEAKPEDIDPLSDSMTKVWTRWKGLFDHKAVTLNAARRGKLNTRLRRYGELKCLQCLAGYRVDPWEERVTGGLRTHDLDVLFANEGRFEKGLELFEKNELDALRWMHPKEVPLVASSLQNVVISGAVERAFRVSVQEFRDWHKAQPESKAALASVVVCLLRGVALGSELGEFAAHEENCLKRLRGVQ